MKHKSLPTLNQKNAKAIGRVISIVPHDKSIDAINTFIGNLMDKYAISFENVVSLLQKKRAESDALSIPVELFQERRLGVLEVLVKYLKEEKNLRYKEIALLLNRDERTIWVSYANSSHKRKARFVLKESSYMIPISVFSNRNLAPLQALVTHLKKKCDLTYHEIGVLLNRDDRIIWATYNRA